MMDEPEGGSLDLAEVEAELCRLPDVAAVRIVADPIGRPVEVHVLAHTGKRPSRSSATSSPSRSASFGIELDRRIVSVVQLGPNGTSADRRTCRTGHDEPRNRLDAVADLRAAHDRRRWRSRSTASEAVGFAEGSVAGSTRAAPGRAGDARRAPPARARRRATRRRRAPRSCASGAHDVVSSRSSTSSLRSSTTSRALRCCTTIPTTRPCDAVLDATNRRLPHLARRRAAPVTSSDSATRSAVLVSFRLGGTDGVSIEARKWEWALARARLRDPARRR